MFNDFKNDELVKQHNLLRDIVTEELAKPISAPPSLSNWREHVLSIEIEMDKRGLSFEKIENVHLLFFDLDKRERLERALRLLGVDAYIAKHHRYNLVSSIYQFAGLTKDKDLESQCETLLNEIKKEDDS